MDVDFAPAWNSAGARNFFGEGWNSHRRIWGPLAARWGDATLVTKTTTLLPRLGNMPLHGTQPIEKIPRCIKVNFRRRAVLNAVGLSGPGLDALLQDGRWQAQPKPFVISIASTRTTQQGRMDDLNECAYRIGLQRRYFQSRFGLEVNFSCPSAGYRLGADGLVDEVHATLASIRDLLGQVPLIPKFNILTPASVASEIAVHPACDAICVSNTLPWGSTPRVDWNGLFGKESPLKELGGGGLSGAPLFPLVIEWIVDAHRYGINKPIIAGGGVMEPFDGYLLRLLGASAVEVGCVTILRPWRVRGIIRTINKYKDQ